MITGIDHVIILGDNLEALIQQYEALGFTVTPGGKHPRFTHNALVPFSDGTYLELIAFYEQPEAGSDDTHRWHQHLSTSAGLVDFAVGADNVEETQASAGAKGVGYVGPVQGGRKRLDGIDIRWRSVVPDGDNVGALPFVIEDQTDRGLRVPVEAAVHANGVVGMQSLVVAVSDLDASIDRYRGLLGDEAVTSGGRVEDGSASGVTMLVGPHRLDLMTPTSDGPMRDRVERRGDSVYELVLLAPTASVIDPEQAAQARLRLTTG